MKYSELIEKCIEIRRTWDPITQTLDSHADEFLKKYTDENEKVFIKQVFFGTYRYEEFIKAFNTALFKRSPAETNRNDAPLNAIFVYLVCFRLNELPFEEFKKIVLSQNPVKMHVLFQLLFNVELLDQHVKDDWCKLYDKEYIEDVVIASIEITLPKAADLLATVSMRATGKVSDFVNSLGSQVSEKDAKAESWKPTSPKPFHLSQSKVKALPQPIAIPRTVVSNPIPETTYTNGLKEIEDQKRKRREELQETLKKKLEEGKVQKFNLETEKRPTNLDLLKEEAESKFKKEIEKKTFYKPMPAFDHLDIDVKTNTAVILKEDAIIKKMKQEEEDYLKQVEMNMRDSSEFENWKKIMDKKDSLAQLELQEKRKVEMQLAREAAIKAVEEKVNKNRDNVMYMKELSKEHMKELESKIAEENEYKRQLKEEVAEARENAEIEKQRVFQENKKKHDELVKDQKERWFMKLEEDEIQKKKREELISRIRELERRPKERPKTFDACETMGYGLLEEMSLAQLRERLDQVKLERKEEEDLRRLDNNKKKDEKETDLKMKVAEIKKVREEKARLQAEKRQQKLQEEDEERRFKQALREKSLLEVHSKITKKKDDKQTELERIARELREIKLKRQYLNADKAVLEAQAWKSLEDGAEREIRMRQNTKLMEQEKAESIKLKERKVLAQRAITDIEAKLEYFREFDRTLEEAKQHNEVLFREEREVKRRNHEEIRQFEQAHLDNMATRDPFKTKISAMSLSKSRSTLAGSRNPAGMREDIQLPPSKYTDMKESGVIIEEKPERLES